MNNKPTIDSKELIGSGKWLNLIEISYKDSNGIKRKWENITRNLCSGAVAIIPILKPSNRLVLIRQYRPPADTYMIEFPAGLIDPKETAEATAIRELIEETGYSGVIEKITAPVYSSPGLTSETVHLARINIDETSQENIDPKPRLEDGEEIETILVPIETLTNFLQQAIQNGDSIDAKVMSFAEAREI